MIGIYIIRNTINNKVYIGQSVNIEQRWATHKSIGGNNSRPSGLEYKNKIHTAMREYGKDNFYCEVLEECTKEELSQREQYWIEKYNSFYDGYNGSKGGSWKDKSTVGEENGRSVLKENDVYYIRECYNSHVPFREVYEQYKDKISKRGLQKIWYFETWNYVLPEYNTVENKQWHSTCAKANPSHVASNNKRKLTDSQVKELREFYDNNHSIKKLHREKYSNYAYSTVYNAATRQTYKDIV